MTRPEWMDEADDLDTHDASLLHAYRAAFDDCLAIVDEMAANWYGAEPPDDCPGIPLIHHDIRRAIEALRDGEP